MRTLTNIVAGLLAGQFAPKDDDPAAGQEVKRDDVLPGGGARGRPALHLFQAIALAAIYYHGQRLWPAHLTAFNRKPGIVVEKNTSRPTIGLAVFP
jgi:hypothetical protein